MVTITYLDIQRLSTEDGPGLRTTVFFKGCPLRCAWCHNPESLRFAPEVLCVEDRCMGCGLCVKACQSGARVKEGGFHRSLCKACGQCVESCPTGALERKGTVLAPEKLAQELIKDKAYWGTEGGVTLSGGEALAQPEGALALLGLLKAQGIHTAVDTCGLLPWETLEASLPLTDLYLYDLKLADGERHRECTGADNQRILENARKLHDFGAALWIRTPIIPGATDSPENVRGIGAFIAAHLPRAQRWELCAYNNLGRDKYRRLDLPYAYATTPLLPKETMERLCAMAQEYYPAAVWTGATELEEAT